MDMPAPLIDPPALRDPPAELVSFVERHVRDAQFYDGDERRSERRYLMVLPVTAQPVDEQYLPTGTPFAVVSRDISPKGIGLVHSEPVEHSLLALQMFIAAEEVNLVADVQWCQAYGPFYYFGGEFVKKLERFPQRGAHAGQGRSGFQPDNPIDQGTSGSD
jgi:hypothetical protein